MSIPALSTGEKLGAVFSPDKPIEDPEALFGRERELRELMAAYNTSVSTVPVLVGPPGIGKSSLLAMLRQSLIGYNDVLDVNLLAAYRPAERRRLVVLQRCARQMRSPIELSDTILGNLTRGIREKSKGRAFRLRDFELSGSVGVLGGKVAWERLNEDLGTEVLPLKFDAILASGETDEIVVLLDECEQLPWIDRLLDWTRDFSLSETRFCLAVRDHAAHQLSSAKHGDYRWPRRVGVEPLSATDVSSVFQKACVELASLSVSWSVSPDALNYIAHHSGGEPWYIQMVGSELLLDPDLDLLTLMARDRSVTVATGRGDVVNAERRVLNNRLLGLHSQRYSDLVSRAPKREELLRALAKFPGTVIPEEYVRDIARFRIPGVTRVMNPLTEGIDPILVKLPRGNSYQFSDHQFKVYCRLIEPFNPSSEVFAASHVEAWRVSH